MNWEEVKEELEVGDQWEDRCAPIIGIHYECIDGSGLIVECIYVSPGESNIFGGVVIETTDIHHFLPDLKYRFLRSAFKFRSTFK